MADRLQRLLSATLILTMVALSGNRIARAQETPAALEGFGAYAREAMQDWEVPGLAVAIVKDGEVVFANGYGTRKVGAGQRVNENTLFAIGSTTKAFTVGSLGMLVEEGKLDWDDPVTKYLEGFQLSGPYVTRELTVRDLLTHRAGLPRSGLLWYGTEYSREEILQRIRHLEPNSSFRSRFNYQNVMYLAAGQIIPAVTGTSWDQFVDDRLFDPLDMDRSRTSVEALSALSNVATPHEEIDGKVTPVDHRNIDNIGPAGAIYSSAREMAHWIELQLGRGTYEGRALIDSAQVAEMHEPQMIINDPRSITLMRILQGMDTGIDFWTYGLGWFVNDYRAEKMVWHGGHIDGMSTEVAMIPGENLGMVFLANKGYTLLIESLMFRVIDAYLGVEARDWSANLLQATRRLEKQQEKARQKRKAARAKNTEPSLPLEAYAGTYRDEMYGTVKVIRGSEGLVLHANPSFVGDLEHWHYDTFRVTWRDRQLGTTLATFQLDAEGDVAELEMQGATFERASQAGEETKAAASDR